MGIHNAKKIYVVGGGYTGISSHILCESLGLDSTLFERTRFVGGIHRDWFANEDWFFRNCQYLIPEESLLFKRLSKPNNFRTFRFCYGSYCDLWDDPLYTESYYGPVYPGIFDIDRISAGDESISTLEDKLSQYPTAISLKLVEWVSYLGFSSNKLHHSSDIPLGLSRVYVPKMHETFVSLKKKSSYFDAIYGLPSTALLKDLPVAAIPINGYSSLFDEVESSIKGIVKGCSVTSSDIEAMTDDKDACTILCGNPLPFWNYLYGANHHYNSYSLNCKNVVMYLSNTYSHSPFYLQVYSMSSPILRIYIYGNKCTIESLDRVADEDVIASAVDILEHSGRSLLSDATFVSSFKDRRDGFLSTKDMELLRGSKTINRRIIPGGLHIFGKEQKIRYIKDQLIHICT